jgi:hypothetical protein
MIRRSLSLALLLGLLAIPAHAQSTQGGMTVASNVDVTTVPLTQATITLPNDSAIASYSLVYAFVIQSPGPGSHADWIWEFSNDGGVTFTGSGSSGGCDGGYVGVFGVPTLPLTPATCGDSGIVSNDAAGKVIRLRVTNTTGGLWTILSATAAPQ